MFSNAGLPAPLPTELSSFVGREREVAEVRRLLMTARMLTLTGTGGVGKTRLAMRVAAEIQRETAVPVRLAELGGIASSALLPQAVVSALGVFEHPGRSPTEVLIEVLQQQPVCLVLDNCEHVIAASAELAERLLRGCPELQILATSREPLRVRGETVWRVPSLTLPPKPRGHMSSEQVAQSEAVRLFIERAQVSLPEFALDDLNAAAIAEVCRKLDGIPLALELAAGRVAVLSVEQLTERLDHALGLLTEAPRGVPGRQQTLRATLDWSHSLLTETEQFLLARLSVFAGGWTLDAAEAVGADQAMNRREVLDVLAGLVAKSLVLSERHKPGPYRYRMLETIRQYGREKLMERGEADPVRRRHAEYFVRLAEQLQVELLGHGARAALDELEQEQDNLRASLDWMLEREEAEQAQRLAGALGRFWQLRCHFGEGQAWVRRALSLPTPEPRTAERARCLYALGNLMHGRGDIAEAEVANREALAIWRALGNTAEQGWTLFALGQEARLRGDYSAARDLLEQSVAVSQAAGVLQAETNSLCRLGDVSLDLEDDIEAERRARSALARASAAGWTPGVVIALRILGEISMLRRDCESAARQFEASLASARELGNRLLSAQALVCLGQAAIEQGDHGRARQHLAEALELARMVEDHAATARGLEVFGALAIGAGRVGDGVGLVGAASALRAAGGGRISPREQRWLKGYLAKARAVLGEAGVERAFQAGVLLSPTRAIDCALELRLENSRPVQAAAEKLTTRERETAMLVARGLSNRQIAEQLVIGERTVQTHVGNILGKLGLTSRAQIAVWVTEHKLQSKNP